MSTDERPPDLEWMKADAPSRRRARDEELGRDHATADALHREDLARDVARLWHGRRVSEVQGLPPGLFAALDRLTAALLPDGPQDEERARGGPPKGPLPRAWCPGCKRDVPVLTTARLFRYHPVRPGGPVCSMSGRVVPDGPQDAPR